LFGRHLQMREIDCEAGDQLTRELQDFIRCVRTGDRPRVDGRAGRDAVALACRILDSMTAHRWDGVEDGPAGPHHLPAPMGTLFTNEIREAA
jgi:predicted dehydrogenase